MSFLISAVVSMLGWQYAHAAVIGTQAAIELDERAEHIAQINSLLARDEVRSMLAERGVSPEDAAARVATMTDAELKLMAAELDALPAGGSLIGTVGIVAIVLVILELLDVIDLFTRF